jgi:hypothetical protein
MGMMLHRHFPVEVVTNAKPIVEKVEKEPAKVTDVPKKATKKSTTTK